MVLLQGILGVLIWKIQRKLSGITFAFMAFSTVWGFGNVLNGFVYFNGIQVIFSWILMFAFILRALCTDGW